MGGVIGGTAGYLLLKRLGRRMAETDGGAPAIYRQHSKLEVLFGPDVWTHAAGRTVLDYGCGTGDEAIQLARHGARRVIGLDIRDEVLEEARRQARAAGVADRCAFVTDTDETADVILSVDAFEHFADPAGVLDRMRRRLAPRGTILIAFGPPWLHPLGGHLFSVFPWAHLVFTERALIRWRADFKSDGATRFSEVAGGLNQMTVSRFERLVAGCGLRVQSFEARPIRRLRWAANRLTRELVTSVVVCELAGEREALPRPAPGTGQSRPAALAATIDELDLPARGRQPSAARRSSEVVRK